MPTRYLKSGVRDSESIDKLSPLAETLFYRLLVTVDDFGRFDARPAMIKANCFPIKDSVSINKCKDLLDELEIKELIIVYIVSGKEILQMCKWDNVPRAKESKYPAPVHNDMQLHTSVCNTHTDAPLTVTVTETKTETKTKTDITPDGVSQSVWDEFVKHRKSKKAQITQLVIDGIQKEADKAGFTLEDALKETVIRNWQSFKAEWVTTTPKLFNKADVVHQTVPASPYRDPALVKLDEDRLRSAPPNPEVLARIRAVLGKTA